MGYRPIGAFLYAEDDPSTVEEQAIQKQDELLIMLRAGALCNEQNWQKKVKGTVKAFCDSDEGVSTVNASALTAKIMTKSAYILNRA